MTYLKERYGRTKSQQASVVLDGVTRDGRLPSEMFSFIKDRVGNLTIDDIIKEMVLRELPTEIQRTIHDQAKSLNGEETTKLADSFFDKDGKPIHRAPSAPISNIEEQTDTPNMEDGNNDVNAVNRFKPRNQQSRPSNQQSRNPSYNYRPTGPQRSGPQQRQFRPQQGRAPSTPHPAERRENRGNPTVKDVKLCHFHQLYGDAARTCETGCIRYPKWSGNAKAGRHT